MKAGSKQAEIKDLILETALQNIPYKGWSHTTLVEAAKKAGYDEHTASLVFNGGVDSLLEYYINKIDQQMMAKFEKIDSKTLKIHEKIYEVIVARLEILEKQKLVTSKTVTYLCMPWNLNLASKLLWNTVDIIWRDVCNDTSTDFNYYTKRTLLYGVYTNTIMYWLSDDSEDFEDTKDFLIRRLQDVLKIGGFINKIKKKF